jgi:hypothetical protein
MSRPLSQGPDIIMQDIQLLNRMLRRVLSDPKRYPHERVALVAHFKGAIAILMHGMRASEVLALQAPKKRTG